MKHAVARLGYCTTGILGMLCCDPALAAVIPSPMITGPQAFGVLEGSVPFTAMYTITNGDTLFSVYLVPTIAFGGQVGDPTDRVTNISRDGGTCDPATNIPASGSCTFGIKFTISGPLDTGNDSGTTTINLFAAASSSPSGAGDVSPIAKLPIKVTVFDQPTGAPEASVWALLSVGFGGVGMSMRRRFRHLRTA